ncbi:hypothetical protein GCM10017781_06060 [Deinococcus metalli]|uniref:Uncharacterized protein n=1 Tax=Deinococcus metalli TaxID=1141878 RepID=A0ABQ3JJQ7_9DEIO|nr:hypothetical protein GCM10017781_06060 [Deinococcus metalli]
MDIPTVSSVTSTIGQTDFVESIPLASCKSQVILTSPVYQTPFFAPDSVVIVGVMVGPAASIAGFDTILMLKVPDVYLGVVPLPPEPTAVTTIV